MKYYYLSKDIEGNPFIIRFKTAAEFSVKAPTTAILKVIHL